MEGSSSRIIPIPWSGLVALGFAVGFIMLAAFDKEAAFSRGTWIGSAIEFDAAEGRETGCWLAHLCPS